MSQNEPRAQDKCLRHVHTVVCVRYGTIWALPLILRRIGYHDVGEGSRLIGTSLDARCCS